MIYALYMRESFHLQKLNPLAWLDAISAACQARNQELSGSFAAVHCVAMNGPNSGSKNLVVQVWDAMGRIRYAILVFCFLFVAFGSIQFMFSFSNHYNLCKLK